MIDPYVVAEKWLQKSATEEDNFDCFVYAWFSFNALYSSVMVDSESDAVARTIYKANQSIDRQFLRNLLRTQEVQFFMNRMIRDCRNPTKDNSWNHMRLKNVSLSDSARIVALFLILYQVRCNLFHGNKLFDSDSDQEVMRHSARVLVHYLERMMRLDTRFR